MTISEKTVQKNNVKFLKFFQFSLKVSYTYEYITIRPTTGGVPAYIKIPPLSGNISKIDLSVAEDGADGNYTGYMWWWYDRLG